MLKFSEFLIENDDIKKSVQDIEDNLIGNYEPDNYFSGLPVFYLNSLQEFLNFKHGKKTYYLWNKNSSNSKIRNFVLKYRNRPFYVCYDNKYILVKR